MNGTPRNTSAETKPMNSGTTEHEQNGVTVPRPPRRCCRAPRGGRQAKRGCAPPRRSCGHRRKSLDERRRPGQRAPSRGRRPAPGNLVERTAREPRHMRRHQRQHAGRQERQPTRRRSRTNTHLNRHGSTFLFTAATARPPRASSSIGFHAFPDRGEGFLPRACGLQMHHSARAVAGNDRSSRLASPCDPPQTALHRDRPARSFPDANPGGAGASYILRYSFISIHNRPAGPERVKRRMPACTCSAARYRQRSRGLGPLVFGPGQNGRRSAHSCRSARLQTSGPASTRSSCVRSVAKPAT